MKPKNALLILFLGWIALAAVSSVAAQSAVPRNPSDDDVNRVAKKLYCPVCPNTPLDVCETKACNDWRAQIRTQLASNWTDQQVIAYFVDQYGERVLAEPERTGFTSLVWVLPIIAVIIGGIFTGYILKSWRTKTATSRSIPTPPDVAPQVIAAIENELRKMD